MKRNYYILLLMFIFTTACENELPFNVNLN